MANRIIITDQNYDGDNIRLVQRSTLPMVIGGIAPGDWSFVNTSNAVAVAVGGVISQLRSASGITNRSIHSGHSLTDAYSYGNGWPGDLNRIRDAIFGDDTETPPVKIARSTIPGSPMSWRWDNLSGSYDERRDVADFDTLVITEGGPPPRTTQATEMRSSLDYLCRFTANQVVNGAGNEVILWSIWPALNGPGTSAENTTPTGVWSDFNFRSGLDEYWRSFKYMADYATWKIKSLYPSLPSDWRVWMFPGDRFIAQVFDDILEGKFPGVENFSELFTDEIHPGNLLSYGLGCFVATCLYQVDIRDYPEMYFPDTVTLEQAEYFWGLSWEIANRFEHVGMGGLEGTEVIWNPSMGDPLPSWSFEGATIPEEPEEPEEPVDPPGEVDLESIEGLALALHPGGILGVNETDASEISALLPPIIDGNFRTSDTDYPVIQRRGIPLGNIAGDNVYGAIRFRFTNGLSVNDVYAIAGVTGNPPNGWGFVTKPVVQFSVNRYINASGASHEGNGSGSADNYISSGDLGSDFHTLEFMTNGSVFSTSFNGSEWRQVTLDSSNGGSITETLKYLVFAPSNTAVTDIKSIVVYEAQPTSGQRVMIRTWLENPEGGIAISTVPSVPTPVLAFNRAEALGTHGATARTAAGAVTVDGYDITASSKGTTVAHASPSGTPVYIAARVMLPENFSPMYINMAFMGTASGTIWDNNSLYFGADKFANGGALAIVSPGGQVGGVPHSRLTAGTWVTYEAWITPEGVLSTSLDGSNPQSSILQPKGATSHIRVFYDTIEAQTFTSGIYIAEIIPTELQRKAVRQWLAV